MPFFNSANRMPSPFVGIIAAGYIARGIASQLLQSPVEIRLAAIANRTVARAERILC
jgi:glutamyl-tRNA reductase